MPKGVVNPKWELAASIAREMGNETAANIKRILKEFKEVERDGHYLPIVIECWRWLRTREEFPISEARITTTLKGSPVYLAQYKDDLLLGIPPVHMATAHDEYVLKHGAALYLFGFKYRMENQPERLTTAQLVKCGLKPA